MLLEIDHHSGQPIYRQVIEQIRRQIMAGQLAEGTQLVSVRDLAGRLKVNPMTISKAYSLLEHEGLLERRRGVGLFVAKLAKDKTNREKEKLVGEGGGGGGAVWRIAQEGRRDVGQIISKVRFEE